MFGPNAHSNYGTFAQHVMDEHITAHLVGVSSSIPLAGPSHMEGSADHASVRPRRMILLRQAASRPDKILRAQSGRAN